MVSEPVKRIGTEEPDEVNLHVRICGEGAGQPVPLPGRASSQRTMPALNKARLGEIIDLIATIGLGDRESRQKDILGRVYEYFLANPPFNMEDWGYSKVKDDVRWKRFLPAPQNRSDATGRRPAQGSVCVRRTGRQRSILPAARWPA